MARIIIILIFYAIGYTIYSVSGKNKRQYSAVPPGMTILCQHPKMRYLMYASCVVMFFFIVALLLLSWAEGGFAETGIYLIFSFSTIGIAFLGGYISVKNCVYFNNDKLQINRAFKPPKTVSWHEITNVKFKKNSYIRLYNLDGEMLVNANSNMINFEQFCSTVFTKCRIYEQL